MAVALLTKTMVHRLFLRLALASLATSLEMAALVLRLVAVEVVPSESSVQLAPAVMATVMPSGF